MKLKDYVREVRDAEDSINYLDDFQTGKVCIKYPDDARLAKIRMIVEHYLKMLSETEVIIEINSEVP